MLSAEVALCLYELKVIIETEFNFAAQLLTILINAGERELESLAKSDLDYAKRLIKLHKLVSKTNYLTSETAVMKTKRKYHLLFKEMSRH